jgi:hypothetical protein
MAARTKTLSFTMRYPSLIVSSIATVEALAPRRTLLGYGGRYGGMSAGEMSGNSGSIGSRAPSGERDESQKVIAGDGRFSGEAASGH